MVFRTYEKMVLAETGQHRARVVTDEVQGELVHYLSVGVPDLRVGLIRNIIAQGANGVLGGLGVPGFSVVERDSLPEGKPPLVGPHLLKTNEASGSDVGKFRAKEGEGLGDILHYLVGIKGSADPWVRKLRLFVNYGSDIVPAGHSSSRPGRGGCLWCFYWGLSISMPRSGSIGGFWGGGGWGGGSATSD
jgi:hypothetical protein